MLARRLGLVISLLLATCVGGGCSIYHDARRGMPAREGDRLAMRFQEARAAADGLRGAMLGADGTADTTGVDTMESYAWEYSRRIAAVRDVADSMGAPVAGVSQAIAQMERAEASADDAWRAIAARETGSEQLRLAACEALALGSVEAERVVVVLAAPAGPTRGVERTLTARSGR